jgi:hypothetical protein
MLAYAICGVFLRRSFSFQTGISSIINTLIREFTNSIASARFLLNFVEMAWHLTLLIPTFDIPLLARLKVQRVNDDQKSSDGCQDKAFRS